MPGHIFCPFGYYTYWRKCCTSNFVFQIHKKMKRSSTAVWNGTGKEGKGNITSQSRAIDHAPYAWGTRFENEKGTNPEELIAAAHAGCFTMKLSFLIGEAGLKSEELE